MLKLFSFTFGPFQENTYVLANENKEAIIIDPGMYFEEEKTKLKSFLEKEGLTPVQLILTHAHIDHVFGLQWVFDQYKLEPFMHPNEQIILDNAENTAVKYGLELDAYKGKTHYLTEEDPLHLGEDKLDILFVPGHSPGSIVFYTPTQNFLIAGDTLFQQSIGRTDLPFGNHEHLVSNIKEKLFALPNNTQVFPGHGGHTTIGQEKESNPFLR
ncbi:MAG: MBL fold hydrolase [Pseudopedobacter saltans]|uniref:MBL fold hydrolase n=1 Tax=Pseudopedobacter saltans TaxID=151895 RepID=A0A2W5H343_9SPHI|nr:MAG: MBL fold hydrolase [Pseudopedobacter saltans]